MCNKNSEAAHIPNNCTSRPGCTYTTMVVHTHAHCKQIFLGCQVLWVQSVASIQSGF